MPSSFTPRLRLEMQAAGENLNTWGAPKLNTVIARIDTAIAGRTALDLTGLGSYALAAGNGEDEARAAFLDIQSLTAPCTLTLPSVSKLYTVRNGGQAALTLTTGSGTTAVLAPGEITQVACDGTHVRALGVGGLSLKAYVDATAFTMAAGGLPGQSGPAGRALTTDGVSPAWTALSTGHLSNYAQDQAARAAGAMGLAITFAVSL